MALRKSVNKDDNFYKRVLNRSLKRFLEDLDPVPILDLFLERDYIDYTQVRDIQEQRLTSQKTREIIKRVSAKDTQGYKTFKTLLKESHQEHLAEFLDKQESDLEKEIRMADKEKEEGDRQARLQQPVTPAQTGNNRIPSDRELLSISTHVGVNWEMLGPFLGVPTTTVDQIKLDNSTTQMKIYRLFYVWRSMKGLDATVKNLLSDMKKAPRSVNIAWDSVRETVNHYDAQERTAASDTFENTTGARPKTRSNTINEGVVTPMQQLSLGPAREESPGRNPPSSLMIGKHYEDSYKPGQSQFQSGYNPLAGQSQFQPGYNPLAGQSQFQSGYNPLAGQSQFQSGYNPLAGQSQFQSGYNPLAGQSQFQPGYNPSSAGQSQPDYNPSLAAMQGELGRTRRQGEGYSNVNDPDVSGKNSFFENRPDGPVKNTEHGTNADETDAARVRSVEQELNQNIPAPTYPVSMSVDATKSQHMVHGASDANHAGGNVTVEPSRPENSLEKMAEDIKIIKQVVVGQRDINPTQEVTIVKEKYRPLTQRAADSVDGNTEERDRRLKDIFDSEQDMKGRLIELTKMNVEDLLSSCSDKPNDKGGFGDIYITKAKVPGIDMRLVVKKLKYDKEEVTLKVMSSTNEKLCARTMHFAIVPLLGFREDQKEMTFYFLSPYMENGNLNLAIEEDTLNLAIEEDTKLEKKGQQPKLGENGNLNLAIEEDTKLENKGQQPKLGVSNRLMIMFQIASAIDFLHTPVKDIRGLILHMDVKSLNIVLDQYFNARLIDFGLAREMKQGFDDTKTTRGPYLSTPGYGKETDQHILAKHDDYRCFGVVIRELLTGEKPIGSADERLLEQSVMKIRTNLMEMWKVLKVEPSVADSLVELSDRCINQDMTSKELVAQLKGYLAQTNTERWVCSSKSKVCDMCLQYKSAIAVDTEGRYYREKEDWKEKTAKEQVLRHNNCRSPMNVCVSCMRNSYCNPIRCHSCDTVLTPTIGHGWAALLIAGNDRRDSVAKYFKEDVKAIHKVITSKCPLVMGISADHVQIVSPDQPGRPDCMLDKLQESVSTLKEIGNIQTLLVYFSGHYKPAEGGFELSQCKKEEKTRGTSKSEFLTAKELESLIADILQRSKPAGDQSSIKQRAIVLFDCCSAPAISMPQNTYGDFTGAYPAAENTAAGSGDANSQNERKLEKPPKLTLDQKKVILQINACRSYQLCHQEQGGSKFRKCVVQGLTRIAFGEPCRIPADGYSCNCFIGGDFVTVGKLHDYISSHMTKSHESESVMNSYNASGEDVIIGYVVNFKADLNFIYRFKDKLPVSDKVPQRMFSELLELQILLFDRYVAKMELDNTIGEEPKLNNADFNGMLCIGVDKGPKERHRDRLESLDRIMTAWNAKRELLVTLRTLPEILDGMVGIFMPSDQIVLPILEYLDRPDRSSTVKKDNATVRMVKLGDDFKKLFDGVFKSKKVKRSSMDLFCGNLVDIEEALKNDEKDQAKVCMVKLGDGLEKLSDDVCKNTMRKRSTMKPFNDHRHDIAKALKNGKKDQAKICIVKLRDDLKKLSDDVCESEMLEGSSMEQFKGHVIDIKDTLKELQEVGIVGELHIIFPCAISSGNRIHRRDFLCYQLIEQKRKATVPPT